MKYWLVKFLAWLFLLGICNCVWVVRMVYLMSVTHALRIDARSIQTLKLIRLAFCFLFVGATIWNLNEFHISNKDSETKFFSRFIAQNDRNWAENYSHRNFARPIYRHNRMLDCIAMLSQCTFYPNDTENHCHCCIIRLYPCSDKQPTRIRCMCSSDTNSLLLI